MLLKYKTNVDAKSEDKITILYRATGRGDTAVVQLLLKYKTNVDAKAENKLTTLH